MAERSLKFLLVPALGNRYDQVMLDLLARALRALGQQVHLVLGPTPSTALRRLCLEHKFDIVFRVNSGRPRYTGLPKGTRHVSWFQDFHYLTERYELKSCADDDVVYFLGDPHVLGLRRVLPCRVGSLFTGIDTAIAPEKNEANKWDMSLCGFIPPPRDPATKSRGVPLARQILDSPVRLARSAAQAYSTERHDRPWDPTPGLVSSYQLYVESVYQPLSGHLDVYGLVAGLRRIARQHYGLFGREWIIGHDDFIYFTTHYPRLLDRLALARRALNIAPRFALFGPGWEKHSEFAKWHRGIAVTQRELYRIYRGTALNLANNTHGFGLHSRTLECMHAGGAVMMHTSPHDNKNGGMLRHFVPGEHYIAFEPDDFEEVAQKWLRQPDELRSIHERAQALVLQEHTWLHRARQVLADLQ